MFANFNLRFIATIQIENLHFESISLSDTLYLKKKEGCMSRLVIVWICLLIVGKGGKIKTKGKKEKNDEISESILKRLFIVLFFVSSEKPLGLTSFFFGFDC